MVNLSEVGYEVSRMRRSFMERMLSRSNKLFHLYVVFELVPHLLGRGWHLDRLKKQAITWVEYGF